jgi:hypothetical protein
VNSRITTAGSIAFCVVATLVLSVSLIDAQSLNDESPSAIPVPRLVKFSGSLKDDPGNLRAGTASITFAFYQDEQGGAPVWLETQNVTLDSGGHYTVQLGATQPDGLPIDVFASGEARWLGVQPAGQAEQPRVLLLSVPYALKAGDATTLGGLPASAFALAASPNGSTAAATSEKQTTSPVAAGSAATSSDVTTSGGAVNALPLFTTANNIQNSLLTQTGATAINVGGKLNLIATGAATTAAGKNSEGQDFVASAFNKSTGSAVPQTFQLQAEPTGNDTTSASGTLNLLYASGTNSVAETGFKISSKGLISFAAGQKFPGTGTGDGTITAVTAGTDLTGGGDSGNVTLNLDTTKVPQLNSVNTFTGDQTIFGNLSLTNLTASLEVQGQVGFFEGSTATTLAATNTGGVSGVAIFGQSNGSSGIGVMGNGNGGDGIGVEGQGGALGVLGSSGGDGVGVEGQSNIGVEAIGVAIGVVAEGTGGSSGLGAEVSGSFSGGVFTGTLTSSTGSGLEGCCAVGIWGDTGANGGFGVAGTADNGNSFFGENNSADNETIFVQNNSTTAGSRAARFAGPGSGTYCLIQRDSANNGTGDLVCTGTKSAAVPVDGNRMVRLYAVEAADNWFEDAGSGQLTGGSAAIQLDELFGQTVNGDLDYHVFITPNGDCDGLYVTNKTSTGFEVHELHGGHSNIAFDYRIMVRRKGFENVRMQDVSADFAQMKQESDFLTARLKARKAVRPVPQARAATTARNLSSNPAAK